ncbi:RNA polymerase factor sigma-54 [Priestia taiwanensis]|uniref:RNA polymerase sigma-54 factor n=1 Tax=Priestia taiwanensis TaxID=1347902 RepID=A0A917AX66_9BACI|nr:RNA polymerase factor sigma-54 [Priestia taiwanensis]MBM7364433.1 RNA polymerase sigma-54 factor [Priestia taiwanensis]GGE81506.1 RNA polymerase sigma-54 factor [Priestia taiwanensis]
MKTVLLQEQSLKLAMTAELRQAIHLLQYNIQELDQFLHEQAAENPLIELGEFTSIQSKPKSMKHSVEDVVELFRGAEMSLHDYLEQQLQDTSMGEREKKIATYIIFTINGNGYLQESVRDIAAHLTISVQEVEEVLAIVHSFDPAGIGAKDIQECLLLQLQRLHPRHTVAQEIIANHFDLMVAKNTKKLASQCKVSVDDIKEAMNLITSLQPKPGIAFHVERPTYAIPDAIVTKDGENFVLKLNEKYIPTISIGEEYISLMRHGDNEVASYVKEKYRQVDWIIKSLEQRRRTITNVMQEMIRRQTAFFEKGPLFLQPLTMKEVADALDVHESTVSRTVKGKYVQTPLGVYEMRFFFSQAATTDDDSVSSTRMKYVIKLLVEEEEKKKPLSDQKIADVIKAQEGVTISRRTVTKYREQLHIPSSSKRKAY